MQLLSEQQCSQYRDAGYLVVRRLFKPDTARRMVDHYMAARATGPLPGDFGGTPDHPEDPTHHYPRMINMHDWDPPSAQWATAAWLQSTVRQLIDGKTIHGSFANRTTDRWRRSFICHFVGKHVSHLMDRAGRDARHEGALRPVRSHLPKKGRGVSLNDGDWV